jgi:hypothetical protein
MAIGRKIEGKETTTSSHSTTAPSEHGVSTKKAKATTKP